MELVDEIGAEEGGVVGVEGDEEAEVEILAQGMVGERGADAGADVGGGVHKLLVSPAPRSALVFGKAVSAGFRGVIQAVVIYLTVLALHVNVRWNPFSMAGVVLAVMLGSAIFSTFSLIIACLVKSRERFMGIGQLMTMPLFFASNAIYPLALMPHWLSVVALVNPLTYLVDALRGMMVAHAQTLHGPLLNLGFLCIVFVRLLAVATRLYPSLVR